jgi:uncharacterized damage-inducible protein DinB
MYRTIEDFVEAYESLSKGTLGLFEQLEDKYLDQSVGDGFRSLRQLCWHIVATVPEMMKLTGLPLSAVDPESPPPEKTAEIVDGYKKVTSELIEAVKANWNDESLEEVDEMYGQKWKRGFSLAALVHHEIHHRGQITVLLRQAGCKVPGLYGPSKEEWSQYGMEEPPY